jgi:chemotaxis protein CheX
MIERRAVDEGHEQAVREGVGLDGMGSLPRAGARLKEFFTVDGGGWSVSSGEKGTHMSELGFTTEEAIELAIEVWRGFLGIDLIPRFGEPAESPAESSVSGCITLKGSWYGGIVVTLPASLGAALARSALALDDPQPDDICDVVGELANMMAGRLKYQLPPDTQMSLPMVASGDHFHLSIPGAQIAMDLDFAVEDTPLKIQIVRVEQS